MRALWKKYPKRIKVMLPLASELGFCLSLALALGYEVHPFLALLAWVLVGTPVLGIVALLAANTLAVICMPSVDSAPGSGSGRRDHGFAVNPSTGLMMVGGIDTGGNQLGGHWSSSGGSIDCGTSSGSGFGSSGFGL